MTDEEKARLDALNLQAQQVGLSLHKGIGPDWLYYLTKQEPVSGEWRREGPSMTLDEVGRFIGAKKARLASLPPTLLARGGFCELSKHPYELDIFPVIVEVTEEDVDAAPELAYEQASRFVETKRECTASIPAKKTVRYPGAKVRPKSRWLHTPLFSSLANRVVNNAVCAAPASGPFVQEIDVSGTFQSPSRGDGSFLAFSMMLELLLKLILFWSLFIVVGEGIVRQL